MLAVSWRTVNLLVLLKQRGYEFAFVTLPHHANRQRLRRTLAATLPATNVDQLLFISCKNGFGLHHFKLPISKSNRSSRNPSIIIGVKKIISITYSILRLARCSTARFRISGNAWVSRQPSYNLRCGPPTCDGTANTRSNEYLASF